MKRKPVFVLLFSILLINSGYSQNEQFKIVKSQNDNSLYSSIVVNKINKTVIDAPLNKLVDIDNPLYLKIRASLDSLTSLQSDLISKAKMSDVENVYLEKAVSYMNSYLRNKGPETSKYGILESAQKEIDNTSHKVDFYRGKKEFYDACGGRLMDAMNGKNNFKIEKYLQKSMNQINDIIKTGRASKGLLNSVSSQISKLEKEIIAIPTKIKENKIIGTLKREVLLVDNVNVSKNIQGTFIKKEYPLDMHGQSQYVIMLNNFMHFVESELIHRDSIEMYTKTTRGIFKGVSENSGYIIENVDTKELYYTTGDVLNKMAILSKIAEIYENIDVLNIKKSIKENKTILTYNEYSCVLTSDLYDRLLQKDASVIEEMHKSVVKRRALMEKATISADKLRKHINAYKAKTISAEGINEWKQETKICNNILTQIRSLPFADSNYYSEQFDRDEITIHIAIMEYVSYSEVKLGL
jgi:hypothetical protein